MTWMMIVLKAYDQNNSKEGDTDAYNNEDLKN